jgi:hypothetical protein
MRNVRVNPGWLCVLAAAGAGCLGASGEPATGTVAVHLTGSASSGTVYRLRDAIITVDGPTPAFFNTEDDPTRTSLSVDVEPGDYSATVQSGWHIERLDGDMLTTVSATLVSDNPTHFAVVPAQRTNVPLKFRVDEGDVDLTQGYDITLDIDEGIPSPGDGYQAIDAPSQRDRLVFDGARQAIYAVNTLDQEIERFTFAAGRWSSADPVVIPSLTDIALTPNGETLIVLDGAHVSDIALASGSFTPTLRATTTDTFCGKFFDKVLAGDNNKAFIVSNFKQCSGFTSSVIYDTTSHTLTNSASLFHGTAAASADGTRIYAGSSGISPPGAVVIYTPQSNTFSTSSVSVGLFAVSVSGDASRVILQNSTVYSRSLTLLGNLAPGGIAQVSRDASRAYVYLDDAPGPRLAVYDLNGALLPGAVFPLLRTIRLPDSANATNGGFNAVTMATSLDDSQVFISGDRRLLVVPVN